MLAVGVASTAMLLYRYQRSLVYPSNFPAGSRTEVMTPDAFDVPDYESLTLTTPDGEKLHAYLMAQRTRSAKESVRGESQSADEVTARRPTVLFLHANAGNMVSSGLDFCSSNKSKLLIPPLSSNKRDIASP